MMTQDMLLYRHSDPMDIPLKKGTIFKIKGFLSASMKPLLQEKTNKVLYKIFIPAGSKGIFNTNEHQYLEYLMSHGSQFKVLAVEADEKSKNVYLEYIAPGEEIYYLWERFYMAKEIPIRFTDTLVGVIIPASEVDDPEFQAGYKVGLTGKLLDKAEREKQSANWVAGYLSGLQESK